MSAARRRLLLTGATALAVALAARPARPAEPTKDQCVDDNARGQDLRREGKLGAAMEKMRACSDPACPAIVRDDCTKRLDETGQAQPSVVFDVKDASGADVFDVKVEVDGLPLAEKLGGTELTLDPGEHTFTFGVAGRPPVIRTLLLKEGQKARRERVTLAEIPRPAVAATAPAPPQAVASAGPLGTSQLGGLVAGGIGAAAVVAGAVFGALTLSEADKQRQDCSSATRCPRYAQAASEHSAGMTDAALSTTGLLAGGVLLAGGAVLFFTGHRAAGPEVIGSLRWAPALGPAGGGLSVGGAF